MSTRSHTTNAGHVVTVRRHEEDPDVLVLLHNGEEVAELHPSDPDHSLGEPVEWRLIFPDWPETRVVSQPGDVPIREALYHLDVRLDAAGAG